MSELRGLPSVDAVLQRLGDLLAEFPRALVVREIREVLTERRRLLRGGKPVSEQAVEAEVRARLGDITTPSLRRVINATGVILHTNLGRASLGDFRPISGWSNLEYDLESGKRGKRDVHTDRLLRALLEREAILVNNNAAAVFLILHEMAQRGEVIVSRGELIEIGDGFRIPDIMQRSGAVLREVGTTNRTSLEDYRDAINDRTKLILRVHPSNFRVSGFTAAPELEELCALGKSKNIPVYEDLGSGCVVDLRSAGIREPLVSESLKAGVDLVSFSCDKLLGGPQSGIIAGQDSLVQRVRRNPMYRAFRVDKLTIEALERTLRFLLLERWSEIPSLAAIFATSDLLHQRALCLAKQLAGANVRESESPIGGGSTPEQMLPTWLVELQVEKPDALARRLRTGKMPVIARIFEGKIAFDMRTVSDSELPVLTEAIQAALSKV